MKKILTLILAVVMATSAFAAKEENGVMYDVVLTRIIDGDTVAFRADWLPAPLKPELSIRVYGVDTPEKSWRGQCDKERAAGEAASAFTKAQIKASKQHQMFLIGWDKYGGRVLGDIFLDGKSLRQMLIANGYAREYYGEAKTSWCN
jgi:endonuclease YncB( thermonuclease family)